MKVTQLLLFSSKKYICAIGRKPLMDCHCCVPPSFTCEHWIKNPIFEEEKPK